MNYMTGPMSHLVLWFVVVLAQDYRRIRNPPSKDLQLVSTFLHLSLRINLQISQLLNLLHSRLLNHHASQRLSHRLNHPPDRLVSLVHSRRCSPRANPLYSQARNL